MRKTFFFAVSLIFTLSAAWSQSPPPQQVQEAIKAVQSGTPITPEMIEAAKAQYPDLKNVSNEEIQKRISEEQKKGEAAKPLTEPSAIADEELEAKWLSRKGEASVVSGDVARSGSGSHFDESMSRFGSGFFGNTDISGLGSNAPPLPEYILSPGDEIQISTWGRENRSQAVMLDNEGMFHFPPLAPIRISGMRFAAAQELLTREIQKIQGITASVSLGRLRSIRIMVLGEVARPGSFTVPAGATVTSALFRSGGVSEIGSMRFIEVRRGGKVATVFDLYDLLIKGSSKGDLQLLPGDVVFVPLAKTQVAVTGMVKRPGIYEVKGSMRALEAVELAGGLLVNAQKGRLRIDRVQGNKRYVVLDVDMEKVDAKSNVLVQDGDILFVDRLLNRLDDAVHLMGNVNRPGRYQFKRGMTVRDLVPSLKDLKPETYFEYAHIKRPSPDDERPTLLSFSPAAVFTQGAKVPLQPGDTVVIYNRYQITSRPSVSIGGAVRRPANYAFRDAMTISDLVILSGGLTDAHMGQAHLSRVEYTAKGDSIFTRLIKINLAKVLEDPSGPDNLELKPFDDLRVFARGDYVLPTSVSIYGLVNRPGTFNLSKGLGVAELVVAAGGLTKNSFKLNVEVVRRKVIDDSVMTRTVKVMRLKEILEGKSTFELEDGDAVYVRAVVKAGESSQITLSGEFNFPGTYEFVPGERLSSVIRRAGGFTKEAYLPALIFLRESVRQQQLRHAQEIGRRLEEQLQSRLQQTVGETDRALVLAALERRRMLVSEIQNAPYLGRVLMRIDRNYKFAGTDWDIVLEAGDAVSISHFPSTVSVLGEVYSPANVIFTSRTNTIGEILAKAGGVNDFGDPRQTFYISPDGSIVSPATTPWYRSFKGISVEPGGSVVVPPKPPAKDYLEMVAQTTQILFQIAVTAGVIVALY
jgi:polysaccharide export outer membrane protein